MKKNIEEFCGVARPTGTDDGLHARLCWSVQTAAERTKCLFEFKCAFEASVCPQVECFASRGKSFFLFSTFAATSRAKMAASPRNSPWLSLLLLLGPFFNFGAAPAASLVPGMGPTVTPHSPGAPQPAGPQNGPRAQPQGASKGPLKGPPGFLRGPPVWPWGPPRGPGVAQLGALKQLSKAKFHETEIPLKAKFH